ncbi:MAG TPA: hypothetical protein VKA96_02000 [Solirubrobacteraceae bacterium]|nr:hypothetical protein [Solirubrobacteraceae bacterium]
MHQAARALREDDLELTGVAEPGPALKSRRTITITGRPDPAPPPRRLRAVPPQALGTAPRAARLVQIRRRRPGPHPIERMSAPPERLAMWALMMAIVLIVVAALSSHS